MDLSAGPSPSPTPPPPPATSTTTSTNDAAEALLESLRAQLFNGVPTNFESVLASATTASFSEEQAVLLSLEAVFDLVVDAVDLSTAEEIANVVWPALERRSWLLADQVLTSGKQRPQLALLRLANELVKRVGGGVAAGKMMTWAANALPLNDRSGFNANGACFDNKLMTDGLPKDRFWKLQAYMATWGNNAGEFKDLALCIEHVLLAFEAAPLMTSSSSSSSPVSDDDDGNLRYLFTTGAVGEDVLGIQVKSDARFRCHVVVQVLFLLRSITTTVPQQLDLVRAWEKRALGLLSPHMSAQACKAVLAQARREQLVWTKWKRVDKCAMEPSMVVVMAAAAPVAAAVTATAKQKPLPGFIGELLKSQSPAPSIAAAAARVGGGDASIWQRMRSARTRDLAECSRLVAAEILPAPPPSPSEEEASDTAAMTTEEQEEASATTPTTTTEEQEEASGTAATTTTTAEDQEEASATTATTTTTTEEQDFKRAKFESTE